MHARNKNVNGYNFKELIKEFPELKPFSFTNDDQKLSINFTNSDAVKTFNKVLLKKFYGIENWDVPKNYLCPPIPGRADYIHTLADLLAKDNDNAIPKGKKVKILDVGVGANCVYPIVGHIEYGWYFTGIDVDLEALQFADLIARTNPKLNGSLKCIHQTDPSQIFKGVIDDGQKFTATMCNPPFHSSQEKVDKAMVKKWKNPKFKNKPMDKSFSGKANELIYPGGEGAFIKKMIQESIEFKDQVKWFTTLVSKQTNLPRFEDKLSQSGVSKKHILEMKQGHKTSRILAWKF